MTIKKFTLTFNTNGNNKLESNFNCCQGNIYKFEIKAL